MQISDDRLREALHYFTLSPDRRMALAKAMVGATKPPAILDDDVMNALRERRFVEYRVLAKGEKPKPGDAVATGHHVGEGTFGDGEVCVGEITFEGRLWLSRSRWNDR